MFEYVSGAVIETPVGDIQGSFQMAHIDSSGKVCSATEQLPDIWEERF